LKIINANTYATWCEEMAKKSKKGTDKKQTKGKNAKQEKQQQPTKKDYRRERIYTLLTNSENDRELEKNINLLIGKESNVTTEDRDNNINNIKGQISEDVQISIQSIKSTRNRQLPIKYR
jgi:hypothetical protein